MSGQQDDILIAVIGSVGTGKSSFTNLLSSDTGVNDIETSDVRVASFRDSECGYNVKIADCPGFDDPDISDTDVLKKIADFLLKEYDDKRQLNGLIYLQQISNTSFGGQSRRNLAMFRNICGKKAYKNVVILTTFWDQLANEQGEKREEQLKVTFFKELLEGGACFMRHNRTIESARDVLRHILTLDPTTVQIQEEIRSENKTFEETAAGSVHREEVDRIIVKHSKEMTERRNELEMMKNRGDDALRQRLEEEQAKMQTGLKRWEDEKAGLTKDRDEAIEAQKQMETERIKEGADNEIWRQDQQREWESKFDDQEKKAREMRETITNSEGKVTKLGDELRTTTKRISTLSQELEEERARSQTELKRWKDEMAELTKDRDGAKEAQKRMEAERIKESADNERWQDQQREWESKFDGQEKKAREMRETIANSEGKVTTLRDELETTTKRISALSRELEEERVNLQTGFKQWEGERSELKKNLAEANEGQKKMEADRVKERADNEAWRKDQECEWETRLDAQGKEHAKSMQALRSQVGQEKKARADANKEHERQHQEAATNEVARREQERKNNEQLYRDQEYKWECRLGAQGKEHVKSIQALQSQLDQEKQAHADADKEYERQLQEAATNEAARREQENNNNEQWREDQEYKWESRLDAQGKEHAKLMQALQSQLDQDKNARADAEKEYERQLQEAATNEVARREQQRKNNEQWRQEQDAQRQEHAKSMQALQAQLDQEKQAHAGADKEHERQLQEWEQERENNEQWRKEQYHEWEFQLDAQRREHAKSMQALQSQLDQEKQARADASKEYERQLQEAATSEAVRREQEMKNDEQWRKDQECEWESRLDAQGKDHAKWMEALKIQFDQEKQARADADREHERQLQEWEQERKNNEQWRKEQYHEWEFQLDAQRREHAKSMQALQSQLDQEKQARADASKEYERQLQEAATGEAVRREQERENNEQWRKDQESEWESRLDAQGKDRAKWMEALQIQFDQETQARADADREQLQEREQERENNERWHKDQEREWKSAHEKRAQENIAKHTRGMAEVRDELKMAKKGNSVLSQEFDEERARLLRESARWEIERVELKKGLSEAEEAQERLKDAVREWTDDEKQRQDQECEWQPRFDDQEKKAREISEMVTKSEEEKERTLQQALARWVEERAVLKKCLDEARKAQMRVEEDVAKRAHRERMHKKIIAKHEEEMAGLGYRYDMMRRSNEALRNEYEAEWARSQLRLARWEAERAELKKGLDEATKAQRRVDGAKERAMAWRCPVLCESTRR